MNTAANTQTQTTRLPPAYIAGMGILTAVGLNTAMTSASVTAGINAYQLTRFTTLQGLPIKMGCIPDGVFSSMDVEIDEGDYYSAQLDHVIRMAIIAIEEALSGQVIEKPVPVIFALPEPQQNVTPIDTGMLLANLTAQCHYPLNPARAHFIDSGRAAGILGLELALRYLNEANEDYVLLGGSDSYWGYPRLQSLEQSDRLNVEGNADGLVPGEGAGFLLLTRHANRALIQDQHILRLHPPGIAKEPGHFGSELPYRGDGLDLAFKQALQDYSGSNITRIYSSLNGEHIWAKEYGVASLRNNSHFHQEIDLQHPAECYGDLGAATGPVLLGIAASDLLKKPGAFDQLIYASSDSAWRAAVRMEKRPLKIN